MLDGLDNIPGNVTYTQNSSQILFDVTIDKMLSGAAYFRDVRTERAGI